MNILTHYSYRPLASGMETPKGESLTIPDQSLTIREIVERFVMGEPTLGQRAVHYDEVEDFDNIDPTLDPAFDLADVSTISSEIEEAKANRKAKAQAAKAAAERSEAEANAAKAEADAKAEAEAKANSK